MSWIPKKNTTLGTAAPTAVATQAAPARTAAAVRSHAHSLEMPVVMSVRRLPAPVYGTLMEITAHGAKIRSLVLMERGTEVEFDLGIGSGMPLSINGRVEARRRRNAGVERLLVHFASCQRQSQQGHRPRARQRQGPTPKLDQNPFPFAAAARAV